jgi:hypothetical protein
VSFGAALGVRPGDRARIGSTAIAEGMLMFCIPSPLWRLVRRKEERGNSLPAEHSSSYTGHVDMWGLDELEPRSPSEDLESVMLSETGFQHEQA